MTQTATLTPEVVTAIAALFQQTSNTADNQPFVLTVNGIKVRITGTTLEVLP